MTALASQISRDIGSGLWTADQFLEFHMTRPDEERWQLVDGLAMMMTPPTRVHQKLPALLIGARHVEFQELVCGPQT